MVNCGVNTQNKRHTLASVVILYGTVSYCRVNTQNKRHTPASVVILYSTVSYCRVNTQNKRHTLASVVILYGARKETYLTGLCSEICCVVLYAGLDLRPIWGRVLGSLHAVECVVLDENREHSVSSAVSYRKVDMLSTEHAPGLVLSYCRVKRLNTGHALKSGGFSSHMKCREKSRQIIPRLCYLFIYVISSSEPVLPCKAKDPSTEWLSELRRVKCELVSVMGF